MPSYSKQYQGGYYGPSIDASLVEVGGNWFDHSDWQDDWGIIHLDKGFPSCGYYDPLLAGDNILGWRIRVEGYWIDHTVKPPVSYHDLFNSRGIVYLARDRELNAPVKSYPGMSGGPVMDDRGYVIGITRGNFANGEAIMIKFDDWLYNKIMSNR